MHAFIEKCKSDEEEVLCLRRSNYEYFAKVYIDSNAIKELALNAFDSKDWDTVMIIEQYYKYGDFYKVLFTKENKIHNYIPSLKWEKYIPRLHTLVKKEVRDINKIVEKILKKYAVIINRNNRRILIRSAPSDVAEFSDIIWTGKKYEIKEMKYGGICSDFKWVWKPSKLFLEKFEYICILASIKNFKFRNRVKSIQFSENNGYLRIKKFGKMIQFINKLSVRQIIFKCLTVCPIEFLGEYEDSWIISLDDCQWVWIINSSVYTFELKSVFSTINANIVNYNSIIEDNWIIVKVNRFDSAEFDISFLPNEKDKTNKLIENLLSKDEEKEKMYIILNPKDIIKIKVPIVSQDKISSQLHTQQNICISMDENNADNDYIFKTNICPPKYFKLDIIINKDYKDIFEIYDFLDISRKFINSNKCLAIDDNDGKDAYLVVKFDNDGLQYIDKVKEDLNTEKKVINITPIKKEK